MFIILPPRKPLVFYLDLLYGISCTHVFHSVIQLHSAGVFEDSKDFHGSGALGKPSSRDTWVELSVSCVAGFPSSGLEVRSGPLRVFGL